VSKYNIEFLTPAYRDLGRIAQFHYKMVGPESAEKITEKLLKTIQTLEDQSFAGSEHPDTLLCRQDFRKLVSGEYICIYKVIDKTIFIYRFVHGATDYPKSFL